MGADRDKALGSDALPVDGSSERTLRLLKEISGSSLRAGSVEQICSHVADAITRELDYILFALIYRINGDPETASLLAAAGLENSHPAIRDQLQTANFLTNYSIVSDVPYGREVTVTDFSEHTSSTGASVDAISAAFVEPIFEPDRTKAFGFAVLGIRHQKVLNEQDRTLLSLIADQISSGIAMVHARESEQAHRETLNELAAAKGALQNVQRQALEDLRETEQRFSMFMRHLPGLSWIKDLEGRYVFANDAAEIAFGKTREELYGLRDHEVFPKETADMFRENDLRAVESGTAVETIETLTYNNQVHYSIVSKFPISGPTGNVSFVGGIAIDVTERMRAETGLRESEERFRTVAMNSPVAIFIKDLEGRYTFANPLACESLGKPDGVNGLSDCDLMPPEIAREIRSNDLQVLSKGRSIEIEEKLTIGGDNPRHYLSVKFPLRNTDGVTVGVCGVAVDITARKVAEDALRTSEKLYRAIGESIDYGVWTCDPEGRNTYASESFLKLVGLTQEECSNFGWGETLHPDDAERTINAWKECVRTGGEWDIEHRFRGVDGKYHPILARGVPIRDEKGEVTGWAGINLDINRLKQVEDELREADHRKDEFIATLAHELRNPLAPIRSALSIMQLATEDKQALQQARAVMERQVRQMVRLIDDLLDVSRVSRGTIELRKERADLLTILGNAVETSRPIIDQHHHDLDIDVPSHPIPLEGDLTRLAQVFSNLLNNAAKYTARNGRISLRVSTSDGLVRISVKDNGVGIPPKMLSQVFDMFAQVDKSLEKTQGGLGIGLSIARRLVEMHGGTIEARSDGVGLGSEFIVMLPLAPACESETAEAIGGDGSPQPASPRRILVADDNQDSAVAMATKLQIAGNEVRVAEDGVKAIEVSTLFRPDVILLDIGMPRMNGYEACRRMRKFGWGRDALIIALTGWGQEEDRRMSREAGFDHHLVKPVDLTTLKSILDGDGRPK